MASYSNRGDFNRKTNPFEDDFEEEFEKVNGDEIRTQMQLARGRTLDSTKRSLALIEDSHDMAIRTGEELQCQGEQLNRVERNLDIIQNDMAIAKRHIKSVNSVWGAIGNYFRKPPKPMKSNPDSVPHTQRQITDIQDESSLYFRTEPVQTGTVGSASTSRLQRSGFAPRDAQERQIEANLELISRGLGRLKEDALILGDEIGRQNEQLDRIDVKTDRAFKTVDESEKKVQRILRK